jgi:hypothetical protein
VAADRNENTIRTRVSGNDRLPGKIESGRIWM